MPQSDDFISPIDEGELQSALAAGERRIRAARQRKKQSIRRAVLGGAVAVVLIPLGIGAGIVAGQAPSAPSLIVTWPASQRSQLMASGDAVLSRGTSPLIVSVTRPEDWTVTWLSDTESATRLNFSWTPSSDTSTLTADCRKEPSGWKKIFGFLWPTRVLTLKAAVAHAAKGGQVTSVGSGDPALVWVAPGIEAERPVAWDERALHLLDAAATGVPRTAIVRALSPETGVIPPPTWLLTPNWAGKVSASQDDATYAQYRGDDPETQLSLMASTIYHLSPKVSIKFIVRLDQNPPTGTIRLAFDGKRQHLAWVRHAGDAAGGPLFDWENASLAGGAMPTSTPGRVLAPGGVSSGIGASQSHSADTPEPSASSSPVPAASGTAPSVGTPNAGPTGTTPAKTPASTTV